MKTTCCSIVISMLLAVFFSPARAVEQADEPLFEPHRAAFEIRRGNSVIGAVDVELSRREDGIWQYRTESEITAWYLRMLGISATEVAWFDTRADQVLPLTYQHVSRKRGNDRFWQHRYDWQRMRSISKTHEGDLEIDLEQGTLDPLTLRMAAAAAIEKQAPDFQDLTFTVLERDELEAQHYRFIRREAIEVDGRCFDTAVFERFRKAGSSRNYIAWHARSLGWMPIRLRHHDEGKTIELSLTRWQSDHHSLPAPGACGEQTATGGNS